MRSQHYHYHRQPSVRSPPKKPLTSFVPLSKPLENNVDHNCSSSNPIQAPSLAHNPPCPKNNSSLNYSNATKPNYSYLPYKPPPRPKRPWAHRYFNVSEADFQRYASAYIGVVEKPGMSYNIQEEFIQQGYFSVGATPMRSNLVLLESLEESEMEALIEGAQDWLGTWFSDLRKWSPGEIDNERLTWVRCYGTPVHA